MSEPEEGAKSWFPMAIGLSIIVVIILIIYFFGDQLLASLNPFSNLLDLSYERGPGTLMACENGKINEAGLCYDPAQPGFKCVGPTCAKTCPNSYLDTGLNCLKPTSSRGVGIIPNSCPDGKTADAGLCYSGCNPGDVGIGPVCWGKCPNNQYEDHGAVCTRPADSIPHAPGTVPILGSCPSQYRDDGLFCSKTVDNGRYNYSWGCGTSIVPCYDGSMGCKDNCYRTWLPNIQITTIPKPSSCPSGKVLVGGLCYDPCPQDYVQTGLTCYRGPHTVAKNSYGRGVGTPMTCGPNQEMDAGLCYNKCPANTVGKGPLCYGNCPNSMKDIGITCEKPVYTRGIGTIPSGCLEGQERDGALCYPKCKSGYVGKGPICWKNL